MSSSLKLTSGASAVTASGAADTCNLWGLGGGSVEFGFGVK